MAILSPTNGSHTLTGVHYIESGEGIIEYTTGNDTFELTIGTLDLPFVLAAGSIRMRSGWVAYDAAITSAVIPTTTTKSGENLTVLGTSTDIVAGSGAAILKNTDGTGTDEFYVRLNRINFPFVAVRTGGTGSVSFDVVGENSLLASA